MQKDPNKRIAEFLFELGTMRKLPRMHRQTFLTDDMSDNIATHSYRVAMIGWFLAKMEKVDPYKVVMMCMSHDMGEIRSGDHNWIHKKYVKVFEDEIRKDQLDNLPFSELGELAAEYDMRNSREAVVAKDADRLDQVLLLKEYVWQGNREAEIWLKVKPGPYKESGNRQIKELQTESAKRIGEAIIEVSPSSWWDNTWTNKNR